MFKAVIIDDDRQIVSLLEAILHRYFPGCVSLSEFDGVKGLALIRNHKPDLVIIDVNLPSISGHEVCNQIKRDPQLKNIPVLVITGTSSVLDEKVKSLDSGAEAFLKKPFDVPELIAQVRSLIRLKRAEDELLRERDLLKRDVRLKDEELEKKFQETKDMFNSFIEVMATAIDSLSDYNYNSTKRVARMMSRFVARTKVLETAEGFTTELTELQKENLIIASWLHDIGKMFVPSQILNKYSRLGSRYELVLQRLETIYHWLVVSESDQPLIDDYFKCRELVVRLNDPRVTVTAEELQSLQRIAENVFHDFSGRTQTWLSKYEFESLTVQNGTVTQEERIQIENHVKMTDLLLSKIHFPADKSVIREWVYGHHEYLDGGGYPLGVTGDMIPLETRILTIIDIFEALTSNERPYKICYSTEEALRILDDMAQKRKLDKALVCSFKESKAWQDDGE